MEKLTRSLVARIIAGILLVVSIETAFLSGIITVGIIYNCGYIPSGKKEAKRQVIKNIADDYVCEIENYYRAVLSGDKYSQIEFENRFRRENCNLGFCIRPLDETSDKPVLSNFFLSERQYQESMERYITYDETSTNVIIPIPVNRVLEKLAIENGYNIILHKKNIPSEATYTGGRTLEELFDAYGLENLDQLDEYMAPLTNYNRADYENAYPSDFLDIYETFGLYFGQGTYSTDEADYYLYGDIKYYGGNLLELYDLPTIYVTDDVTKFGVYIAELPATYYFNDMDTQKHILDRRIILIENEFDDYTYKTYYDNALGIMIDFDAYKEMDAVLSVEVAKKLYAHDRFSNSWTLWMVDKFYNLTVPFEILSVICTLVLSVFLIISAGRTKEPGIVKLCFFDKIPFDILMLLPILVLVYVILPLIRRQNYYIYNYAMGYINNRIYIVGIICIVLTLYPIYLVTIAKRAKTGSIFSNTIIWKLLKIIGKTIAKISVFLVKNIGISSKYILSFLVLIGLDIGIFSVCYDTETGIIHIKWLIISFILLRTICLGFVLKAVADMNKLKTGTSKLASGDIEYKVDTEKMFWEFKKHGDQLNSISDGIKKSVDERMKSERMKTELITNVSHDIKTPLTSIINYVDLLEKENIDNEIARGYLGVLDRQSARLKKLIEDLIYASKSSTGNMSVKLEVVDAEIMIGQAIGEFEDKLSVRNLKIVENNRASKTMVIADGKLLWRVIANLFSNLSKYSEEGTRVYIDVDNIDDEKLAITIKNISKDIINVSGDELLERFVRGDSSRNTEGSGLGLSIARSLMELMGGKLEIVVDGDLFKSVILLDLVKDEEEI